MRNLRVSPFKRRPTPCISSKWPKNSMQFTLGYTFLGVLGKLHRNRKGLTRETNRSVWMIKDAIWGSSPMRRRHPRNTWHDKYLELDSQSCYVNELWLKNTSAMTYSRRESKIQSSGTLREGLNLFVFTKRLTLAIYKQRAYILALETDEVGYMKTKKGLGFFLQTIFFLKDKSYFHHFKRLL